MPARRSAAHLVLVAVVGLVLLAGAGVAAAGWQSSNGGTSTGRAGTLSVPANLVAEPRACSGTTGRVRAVWGAVTGAVSYTVEIATSADFTAGRRTETAGTRSLVVSQPNATTAQTLYIRVTAEAGRWTSGTSSTLTTTVGPCPA